MDNPILVHLINRLDNSSDNMRYIGIIHSEGPNGEPLTIKNTDSYERRMPQSADQIVYVSGEITNTGPNPIRMNMYASNRENQSIIIGPSEKVTLNNIPLSILYLNVVVDSSTAQYSFTIVDTDNEQEDQAMLLYTKVVKVAADTTPDPGPTPSEKKKIYLPELGTVNKDTIMIENFSGYADNLVQHLTNTWDTRYSYFWSAESPTPPDTHFRQTLSLLRMISTDANRQTICSNDANIPIHAVTPLQVRIDKVRFRTRVACVPGLASDSRHFGIGLTSLSYETIDPPTVLSIIKAPNTTWEFNWQNIDRQNHTEDLNISADTSQFDIEFNFDRPNQTCVLNFYDYRTGDLSHSFTYQNVNLNFYAELLADSLHPTWTCQAASGKNATMDIMYWELEVD